MSKASQKLEASKARLGRPTTERAEWLDEHLLDVAERLFLSLGFANASLEKLAGAAGASKKTIYHRYASKELLFIAVVERACTRILEELNPEEFHGTGLDEKLENLAYHILDRVLREDILVLVRTIVPEASRVALLAETIALSGHDALNRLIARLLQVEVEAGHLTLRDTPEVAARHLFSLIDGGRLFKALMGGDLREAREEAQKRVKSAVSLFLRGCRA